MERADTGNTRIHHSTHFLLLCTRSLEYKCISCVLFTFVGHRWSQGHKCDVLVWYNWYIKAHDMGDVDLQQPPASFISLMRSASPQVERRLKGPTSTPGFCIVPIQPEPGSTQAWHVAVCSPRCTGSIGVQPSVSNRERSHGQQMQETIKEDASQTLQPSARKPNVTLHTRMRGKKRTANQENTMTRARYLSFGVWLKGGVERHHPFQHFCRLKYEESSHTALRAAQTAAKSEDYWHHIKEKQNKKTADITWQPRLPQRHSCCCRYRK